MLDYKSSSLPEEIKEGLGAGRPILLMARNSGEGGKQTRELIRDELVKSAHYLRDSQRLDITKHLPSASQVEKAFASVELETATDKNGKTVRHKVASLRPVEGLVILMIQGSGAKITKEVTQPAVEAIRSALMRETPILFFVHQQKRVSRNANAWGQVASVCEELGIWRGNTTRGVYEQNQMNDLLDAFESSAGQSEAQLVPVSTRKGMVRKTGTRMVNGRVPWAVAGDPPPGLVRLRMKSSSGGSGESIVCLASPKFLPDRSEVLTGMSELTVNGKPVDCVKLVQFALTHLGKPGWGRKEVGEYLCDNHFYTATKIRTQGPKASFHEYADAGLALRAILRNLDEYESESLTAKPGIKAVPDFTVSDCAPKGGWAKPSDFQRIRAWLKTRPKKSDITANGNLVGVKAVVDGQAYRLRSAPLELSPDELGYILRREGKRERINKDRQRVVTSPRQQFPALPHRLLTDSIVDGLKRAAGGEWIPTEAGNEGKRELIAELREVEDKSASLARKIQRRLEDMNARDENDQLMYPKDLLDHMGKEVEALRAEKSEVDWREQTLKDQLGDLTRTNSVASILPIVHSLRDPADMQYHEWLRENVVLSKVGLVKQTRMGFAYNELYWEGKLTVSDAGDEFEVSFYGVSDYGPHIDAQARVAGVLEEMKKGDRVLDEIPMVQPTLMRRLIALELVVDSRKFGLGTCPDATWQAIGVTAAMEPLLTDAEIAKRYEVSDSVVTRLRELMQESHQSWIKQVGPIARSVSERIARGQVLFDLREENRHDTTSMAMLKIGGFRSPKLALREVTPCGSCGSQTRLVSYLLLPVGLVCTHCFSDDAGTEWGERIQPYLIGISHTGVNEFNPKERASRGTRSRKQTGKRSTGNSKKARAEAIREGEKSA
jgi:hypothetical protein